MAAGHWNRILREKVIAPSLTELKKHLDNSLRHMVGLLGLFCAGSGVGHLVGPFQLRIFHGSMAMCFHVHNLLLSLPGVLNYALELGN